MPMSDVILLSSQDSANIILQHFIRLQFSVHFTILEFAMIVNNKKEITSINAQ